MTWLQLANKTAIVTGAGSGIGAAGKLVVPSATGVLGRLSYTLTICPYIYHSRQNIINAKLSSRPGGS